MHTWINCKSNEQLRERVLHFLECRRRAPYTTSACMLLPNLQALDRSLLKGWKVILDLPKGSSIKNLMANGNLEDSKSQRVVRVLYYPPTPKPTVGLKRKSSDTSKGLESEENEIAKNEVLLNASRADGRLTMHFAGKAADVDANFLFDSGADDNFVSKSFAQMHGISIEPSRTSVRLGNNQEAELAGEARVYVKLGAFHQAVRCSVTELLSGVDVILGDRFMKSQKVMLDYAKSACILRKGKRRITVSQKALARDETLNEDTSNEKSPKLLSALQVKRRLRKGNRVMLAVVSEVKPDQPLTNQVEDWLKGLQTEFSDVFVDPLPPGLPPERNYGHSIPTEPGHVPPFRPMYRLSPIEMRETKEQITTLLANGLIEPSKSPYGAPILFVPKPNGRGLRLCIDFRALNAITIKNRYPIPRIDDLLDAIQGAKYFTNFDLTSGYHQIRIPDEDVPKTAFRTPFGHYQFKVLIEGLTNAPATFQTVMNDIFKPYIRDFVVVYLDDIMVYSKTLEDHKKHVRLVLEVLRKERFYACLAKCEFAKPEIKFLGHIVGADGIKVNPAKIAAVEEWPAPTDVHKVRSFLGLANYFRKFIQGYAKLAAPLTDLTKAKRPWNWTEECQKSFDGIKWSLTHAPVLRSPVESVPYEVVSDASGIGLGAVLLQEDQPVAFESRKLSPAEQNYTTTEQELLGVIHALRVWRCYLEGVRFTVVTDHCPNTFFQTQPNLSRRQARWSEFLQRFDFQWVYRAGRINVADPLSRNPVGSALAVITRSWRNKEVIRAGQPEITAPSTVPARGNLPTFDIADPLLSQLLQAYPLDPWLRDANSQESTRLSTNSQGLYLRDSRVYVPNDTVIKNSIMFEAHDAKYSGHFGVAKTLKLVERLFWWPNFRKEILHYVNHCPLCQYNKSVQLKPAGLLQPLPIPERPWDSVSFDFIVQLPKTLKGHDAIVVFVDRLTKMVHFQPTTS